MTGAVTEDATRPLPRQPGPDPATGPSRLPEARLEHVFERTADETPEATALEHEGRATSYADLDARANQLAHVLADRGVRPGARVALFLERSPETYVALLGALKAGAAFVPVDPDSPADRLAYVADDAGVDLLLTSTALADTVAPLGRAWLAVDGEAATLDAAPTHRPVDRAPDDGEGSDDPTAYVIYTSGSSGRPKGVEVAQSSICNFIAVVPTRLRRAPDGPRLPGHDDLLRLLDRGDLADLGRRRDAGRRAERLAAPGRGTRRLPRRSRRHASCTACRPCWPRSRATCPGAQPPRRRRGLPGRARRAVEPPGAPHAQHLRAHRGDGDGDLGRARARPPGHHRPAAAHLLGRRAARPRPDAAPRRRRARSARSASAAPASPDRLRRPAGEDRRRFRHPPGHRRPPSTAPATSAARPPTARSSTWAGRTTRSRSAATASTSARSRACCSTTPRSRAPWSRCDPGGGGDAGSGVPRRLRRRGDRRRRGAHRPAASRRCASACPTT